MRKALIASALTAPLLVGLAAAPATAAPSTSSPAQACKTMQVPGGPNGELGPLVGEAGYFLKQGGCASTVAHGALEDMSQLSALTTRAGYVQTCQRIRAVEPGAFPFTFAPYPFLPAGFDRTVDSIGECADVLHTIHMLASGG